MGNVMKDVNPEYSLYEHINHITDAKRILVEYIFNHGKEFHDLVASNLVLSTEPMNEVISVYVDMKAMSIDTTVKNNGEINNETIAHIVRNINNAVIKSIDYVLIKNNIPLNIKEEFLQIIASINTFDTVAPHHFYKDNSGSNIIIGYFKL